MSNVLTCINFPPATFPGLRGSMCITAEHLDITRALMTVGYPSHRAALAQVGRWRARMLYALAHGFLDANLRTTPYFRNLEQSERGATCFLLGQAMTLWFAQEHMHLDHLIHVDGCGANWGPAGTSVRAALMRT